MQDLLGKTLVKLAQRKELGLGHMMFIGETLNAIGMTAEASQQFQKILKRMETDQEFAKHGQKAIEPDPHRIAQGAPQAGKIRRSAETGGSTHPGESPGAGAADGERAASWRPGRKRTPPSSIRPSATGPCCGPGSSR